MKRLGVRTLAMTVLTLACGGNDPLKQACVPGQSIACVGPAGCSGGQVCNAQGSAYGPCACAPAHADAAAGDVAAADAAALADAGTIDATPVPPDAPAPLPDAAADLTPPPDAPVPVDLPAPDLPPVAPLSCQLMGVTSLGDFEGNFIVPRCGGENGCHQSVFPPRNLHMRAMIRTALVGKKSQTLCREDFYIDVQHPERSHILATITPFGQRVTCPSGGEGGTRMPNSMPAVAGPRLSEDEIDCFRWWVFEVAAIARRG